jgi:ribosomal protein S13
MYMEHALTPCLHTNSNISGIGNWVGDEIMYQARLHPEQYSNTFSDEQIKRLHDAMMYVCDTAVETLAESDKFPADWLMKHRWGKGKKDGNKLPNGETITFLKVGGRTSAIVQSRQKKTAAVAGDVSEGTGDDEDKKAAAPKKGGKRKAAVKDEPEDIHGAEENAAAKPKRARKKAEKTVKEESEEDEEEEIIPAAKKQKKAANGVPKKGKKAQEVEVKTEDTSGRRRSNRLSK